MAIRKKKAGKKTGKKAAKKSAKKAAPKRAAKKAGKKAAKKAGKKAGKKAAAAKRKKAAPPPVPKRRKGVAAKRKKAAPPRPPRKRKKKRKLGRSGAADQWAVAQVEKTRAKRKAAKKKKAAKRKAARAAGLPVPRPRVRVPRPRKSGAAGDARIPTTEGRLIETEVSGPDLGPALPTRDPTGGFVYDADYEEPPAPESAPEVPGVWIQDIEPASPGGFDEGKQLADERIMLSSRSGSFENDNFVSAFEAAFRGHLQRTSFEDPDELNIYRFGLLFRTRGSRSERELMELRRTLGIRLAAILPPGTAVHFVNEKQALGIRVAFGSYEKVSKFSGVTKFMQGRGRETMRDAARIIEDAFGDGYWFAFWDIDESDMY